MHDLVRNRAAGDHGGAGAPTIRGSAPWGWSFLLALLPVLAACHDDHACFYCGPPPVAPQVSFGLVAADFQHVGHSQVLATSTIERFSAGNPSNLALYANPALVTPGSVGAILFPDGHDPLYLATADLNGDGLPDAVSASTVDGAVAIFLNNPGSPGNFGEPIFLPSPGASQLAIADLNGDGQLDIVSADFNVSLFVQLSPGNFAQPVSLYPGGANWVAVGDLNGDGHPDVALTDGTGVKVLLHTGAASATTFAAPLTVYTTAFPNAFQVVVIADVNGDGLPDLVITDPTISVGGSDHAAVVLLQNPASPGTFMAPVSYALQPHSHIASMVVKDVNGDGLPDIVVGGDLGVSVLLQDAAAPGTFLAAAIYATPNANEIAVADINGDGRPDIVVGTGPAQPVANGVQPNAPGVLLQSATTPGTFGALQSVP
jgi:hypothetical protein